MKILDLMIKKDVYAFIYGTTEAGAKIKAKRKLRILGTAGSAVVTLGAFFTGIEAVPLLALLVLLIMSVWVVPEVLLKRKCDDAKMRYKMEIPDFLDITALLLEAGQPLWYSVEVASETPGSTLAERVNKIFHSSAGMEESRNPEILLDKLASELRTPEVSSAFATIVQNSRKGEKELASVLRLQSSIARRTRRDVAEEMGNKATNLMLIPTMIVFIAVLLMLVTPAVLQMSIF